MILQPTSQDTSLKRFPSLWPQNCFYSLHQQSLDKMDNKHCEEGPEPRTLSSLETELEPQKGLRFHQLIGKQGQQKSRDGPISTSVSPAYQRRHYTDTVTLRDLQRFFIFIPLFSPACLYTGRQYTGLSFQEKISMLLAFLTPFSSAIYKLF